jgi:hypothetical protein
MTGVYRYQRAANDAYLPTACITDQECGTSLPGRPFCDAVSNTCKSAHGDDGANSMQHVTHLDAVDTQQLHALTGFEQTKDATQWGCTSDADCTKRYTHCYVRPGHPSGVCVRGFPEYRTAPPNMGLIDRLNAGIYPEYSAFRPYKHSADHQLVGSTAAEADKENIAGFNLYEVLGADDVQQLVITVLIALVIAVVVRNLLFHSAP